MNPKISRRARSRGLADFSPAFARTSQNYTKYHRRRRNSLRSGSNPHASTRPAIVKSGSVSKRVPDGNHRKSTSMPSRMTSHALYRSARSPMKTSGTHGGKNIAPKTAAAKRNMRIPLCAGGNNVHELQCGKTDRQTDVDFRGRTRLVGVHRADDADRTAAEKP